MGQTYIISCDFFFLTYKRLISIVILLKGSFYYISDYSIECERIVDETYLTRSATFH